MHKKTPLPGLENGILAGERIADLHVPDSRLARDGLGAAVPNIVSSDAETNNTDVPTGARRLTKEEVDERLRHIREKAIANGIDTSGWPPPLPPAPDENGE